MFLNRNGSDKIKLQTKQMNVNVKTIIFNWIYYVLVMVEIISCDTLTKFTCFTFQKCKFRISLQNRQREKQILKIN